MNQYPLSLMVGYPDKTLIKGIDPEVYLIKDGQRRPIESPSVFKQLGLNWSNILFVLDSELIIYPIGEKITSSNYSSVK